MNALRNEDGVAMVEFALVLPILLLVLLGTVSFGFALNYSIDETQLTREAARYAAVNYNPGPASTIQESIRGQADTSELLNGGTTAVPTRGQLCIAFPTNPDTNTSGQVGDPVKATMTVTYNLLPIIGNVLPADASAINITRSATMRLEAVPTYAAGCTS